jgi:hypothetical protein
VFEPTINQEIGFELIRTPLTQVATGTTTSGVGVNVISDNTKSFTIDQFVGSTLLITSGTRSGTSATIISNTATTITVNTAIASNPGELNGVTYVVFSKNTAQAVTQRVIHPQTSFDFTGLTAQTQHEIQIKAYYQYIDSNFGKTMFSDNFTTLVTTLEVSLPAEVLAPVVTATSGYPTQSEVRWNVFNPNDFVVSRAFVIQDGSSGSTPTSYEGTIAANSSITISLGSLANNVTKTLSVRFRVGTTPNFVFSNTTSNTQTTLPPPPPPVPTGLQISNETQNSATASWNAVQSATNGYQV